MIAIPIARLSTTTIEEIDWQHRKIASYINILNSAVNEEIDHNTLVVIFSRLSGLIIKHFADEEHLLLLHGYSGYDIYYIQHQQLIVKMDSYAALLKSNNRAILTELVDYLRDWLLDHISNHENIMGKGLIDRSA
jgi:hemerythrin